MKFIVLIFCVLCLSVGAKEIPKCKEDDCYCNELGNMYAGETEKQEFMAKQKNLVDEEFKVECDKVGKQLKAKWEELVENTKCEQIKTFIKKRSVVWEYFCSLKQELRQEFEGEFFEKFAECDKVLYDICVTDAVDYCEPEPYEKLLKCVKEDMKGKCENSGLLVPITESAMKFFKENDICGDRHPVGFNQHKKSVDKD